MPASENQDIRRGRVLHGLFWGGVGLAPLAVLVLLFGASVGSLRIAVTLSVLTIVALAVSIALRPGVEMVRVDIEHRVLDEMERVRGQAREDVRLAGRNTHRALTEKIRALAATVEALRDQIDELQSGSGYARPAVRGLPEAADPAEKSGVVRRTETVHVTRRTTTVGGHDDPRGTVYGPPAAIEADRRRRDDDDRRYDDARRYVDARGYEDARGYDDSRRYDDDRRDDHRYEDGRRHDRRPDDGRRDEYRDDPPHREDRWDGVAMGDRWASVRADGRGREYRVGERRSSVQKDGQGTEYRMEDRWAEMRRGGDPDHRDEPDWEATFRALSSEPQRPALPASQGESAARYLDDRDQVWSRGREREVDRGHSGRDDERRGERGRDDDRRGDRSAGRGREDRRFDDRRPERGYGDLDYADRGGEDRRDERPYPRPRGPHPSEYDR